MHFSFWPGQRFAARNRGTDRRFKGRGQVGLVAFVVAAALATALIATTASGSGTREPYHTYEMVVAADSPVTQYRFDDPAGATALADSAGSIGASLAGVSTGGGGPFGGSKAGSFSADDAVAMSATPLSQAEAFSVEAWVRWSGGPYDQHILDLGSRDDSRLFLTPAASVSGHPLRFELDAPGHSPVQLDGPTLEANAWHYVAVTEYANGALRLYVDGAQIAGQAAGGVSPATLGTTSGNWLGRSQDPGDPGFDGALSNVAFYTHPLSPEQVRAHWSAAELPVNETAPKLSGTPTDGQTLATTNGVWSGLAPIGFSYGWQRCDMSGDNCQPISGATHSTYPLTSSDVGSKLEAEVTATNSAGNRTVQSLLSDTVAGIAPSDSAGPALSGTARDGSTLTSNSGDWAGSTPIRYAYQWQRCDASSSGCQNIDGATGPSYTLSKNDIGSTVRVSVTGTNLAGSATVSSQPSEVVAALPPWNTAAPSISGSETDDETLTADKGSWDGSAPVSYAYQWQRCDGLGAGCVNIAGATGTTYKLTDADVDHSIRVVLNATNVAASATATSDPSAVVKPAAPVSAAPPRISGVSEQGGSLKASRGTWSGTAPLRYSYQWRRCDTKGHCSSISGATKATYTPAARDVGHHVQVVVTAANPGGDADSPSQLSRAVSPADLTDCTITWSGGGGDTRWDNVNNWSAGRLPTSSDRACVADGTAITVVTGAIAGSIDGGADITINGGDSSSFYLTDSTMPSTVHSLTQAGSTVAGASTLTITGSLHEASSFAWNFMWGPGTTVLAPGATGTIDGGTFFIGSRTLLNEGTLNITGGSIDDQSAALIDNEGTLAFSGSTSYSHASGDPSEILNTGLVVKSSGSGTTSVGLPIDNEGTVDAQVGTLAFTKGGTASSQTDTVVSAAHVASASAASVAQSESSGGIWQSEANATVDFAGGSFSLGQSTNFAGHIQVDSAVSAGSVHGGDVDLAGGDPASLALTDASNDSDVDSLTQRGGTITGDGTLTVTGSYHAMTPANGSSWNFENGTGTTVLAPGATGTIDGGTFFLDGRAFRNDGTLTYSGGSLEDADAALLDNTGTLSLNSESGLSHYGGGLSTLRNSGLLRKSSGTGTTSVPLAIENDAGGTVDAQSGTLAFTNGGGNSETAGGSWQGDTGGTLEFRSGSFDLGQTAQLGGNVQVNAALTAGSLDGSDADVTMGSTDNAFLSLNDADNGSTIKTLTEHGGTIGGDGNLTVTNSMDVSSSSSTWAFQRGPGTTVIAPGATAALNSGPFFLSGRVVQNQGTFTYNGGQILDENHEVIDNQGIFSLPGAGQVFSHYAGAIGEIDNSGTIVKPEGSSGTTLPNIPIHNEALVEVDAGELGVDPGTVDCIAAPPLNDPGVWEAYHFGQLNLDADQSQGCETFGTIHAINGGRVNVVDGTGVGVNTIDATNGTIDIASGTLNVYNTSSIGDLIIGPQGTLTGTAEIDVCPTLDWLGGTMSGTGETDLCSTGSGTIDPGSGGQVNLDQRLLLNHGDLSWSQGSVGGADGSVLSNWGVMHANSESGSMQSASDGAPAVLINHSTLEKDQGNGTTAVCDLVINKGTVTNQTGTLQFCPQFNGSTEENADPDASDCTLNAEGSDLEDTDGDGIPEVYVGFTVDCNPPVPMTVTVNVEGEVVGEPTECSAEQNPCSGLAVWEGLPPENQDCVYWLVGADIPDAKTPNPGKTDFACRPGTTPP